MFSCSEILLLLLPVSYTEEPLVSAVDPRRQNLNCTVGLYHLMRFDDYCFNRPYTLWYFTISCKAKVFRGYPRLVEFDCHTVPSYCAYTLWHFLAPYEYRAYPEISDDRT